MTMMKSLLAAATTVAMSGAAMADGHSKTIVDIAAGDDRFTHWSQPSVPQVWPKHCPAKARSQYSHPSTQHSQPCQKAQWTRC